MVGLSLELTPTALLKKLQSLPSHSHLKNAPIKILVAFSGGLDSHVLLHLFSKLSKDDINLRAIYINHGLQAESDQWTKHCELICNALAVDFKSVSLNLRISKGESIEQLAREGRYQALSEQILEDEVLVTAHHQNDQAETFLLQLFRGAGVQGLASMAAQNSFDQGRHLHIRPLLGFSRDTLEAYAKQYDLDYIEDPSNKDITFDRNFLRQNIMPQLRQRWLGIDKTISRSAAIQAETKTLLDELAEEILPKILSEELYYSLDNNQQTLAPIDLTLFSRISLAKQRLVLRHWIAKQGFLNPSDKKLSHIFSDLIDAAEDKQPTIKWQGAEMRRYQNRLFIMSPLMKHDASKVIDWNLVNPIKLTSLSLQLSPADIDVKLHNPDETITIRFRQGGEKIEIPKRGNISLKNYFQELGIPPWIRSRLPLVYAGEKLVEIVGLEDYKRHPPTF